jgi:acetylornithine deacetylase/succinyl-diaminopimelate desuccinylase-like protein
MDALKSCVTLPKELFDFAERNRDEWLKELSEFLKFQSISSDPAFSSQCQWCAEWLGRYLNERGFDVELIETPGKPVVWARYVSSPLAPHITYYGHYDVQPPGELDDSGNPHGWTSPPFVPTLRENRLYARGSSDNKGQTFYLIKACEYLIKCGAPCNLTLLIEGEEESGSYGLSRLIASKKVASDADVLLVCDSDTVAQDRGTLVAGFRGMVSYRFTIHGPRYDLHSGLHGGVAPNPAHEACRLVALLHGPDGEIAIPGYYDGIVEPSLVEKELLKHSCLSDKDYEKAIGILPLGGEQIVRESRALKLDTLDEAVRTSGPSSPVAATYSFAERRGLRPTIEVNGMFSGHTGPGGKSLIPSRATVILTSRVVRGQRAAHNLALLDEFIQSRIAKCFRLEVEVREAVGDAVSVSLDEPVVQAAHKTLLEQFSHPPIIRWEGGSIPVLGELLTVMPKASLVGVGFSLDEDRMHGPDESFDIEQLYKGFVFATRFISAVSRIG